MKIAVQTNDRETVGENFGRARFFALYDTVSGEMTFLSNAENAEAAHGVGIQAAAAMAREGVETVLSYHVGPKAAEILERHGIGIFSLPRDRSPLTIREAIDLYLAR